MQMDGVILCLGRDYMVCSRVMIIALTRFGHLKNTHDVANPSLGIYAPWLCICRLLALSPLSAGSILLHHRYFNPCVLPRTPSKAILGLELAMVRSPIRDEDCQQILLPMRAHSI
jgi:hypothetical protein